MMTKNSWKSTNMNENMENIYVDGCCFNIIELLSLMSIVIVVR